MGSRALAPSWATIDAAATDPTLGDELVSRKIVPALER
jgi:hypothetical protein